MKTTKWIEWVVEYDMCSDGRPMYMRIFNNESDAREFAKDIADATVISMECESIIV